MPGSNPRAMEKAKTLAADAIIFDLEDSVAPEAKETAREQVMAALASGGYGRRELVLRVNGLDTPWGGADLARAAAAGPDAILVPKVSTAAQLAEVGSALASAPGSLGRAGAPGRSGERRGRQRRARATVPGAPAARPGGGRARSGRPR